MLCPGKWNNARDCSLAQYQDLTICFRWEDPRIHSVETKPHPFGQLIEGRRPAIAGDWSDLSTSYVMLPPIGWHISTLHIRPSTLRPPLFLLFLLLLLQVFSCQSQAGKTSSTARGDRPPSVYKVVTWQNQYRNMGQGYGCVVSTIPLSCRVEAASSQPLYLVYIRSAQVQGSPDTIFHQAYVACTRAAQQSFTYTCRRQTAPQTRLVVPEKSPMITHDNRRS